MSGCRPFDRLNSLWLTGICLAAPIVESGCLTQWNTKFPSLAAHSVEYERKESEVQDPFPETDLGPETGFRPLDYQEQRSETQRAKDRYGASFLRQQHGSPQPGSIPGADGSLYPEAVRQ